LVSKVNGQILAEQLGSFVAQHTLYAYYRPFGATSIVGGVDEDGPQLYMIEPSGLYWVVQISFIIIDIQGILWHCSWERETSGKKRT
jgi:20S proteasome alpha/beta subunit